MNPEIIELAALLNDGQAPEQERPKPSRTYTLAEVHEVYRRWLGDEYDFDVLNVVLATAAAERLPGDPVWLLVISGPGNAKTETVQPLSGAGAHVTSTIASEGALLSATAKRERSKGATGGLMRKIGERGLLVIKDVTSILSANRETRAAVLAALREIYDGLWERNVGTDGGRTLTWKGRIGVVGAVTTAWDRAHGVISIMGDRFVLIRSDSEQGRLEAGRRAMLNVGREAEMRAELAGAAGGLLEGAHYEHAGSLALTEDEFERILRAADITTRARTGVEIDSRGKVEFAHKPEAPTRFAKQLVQLVRGAVAIGLDRAAALSLAIRCARDSMPAMRLSILDDVAAHPGARPGDIRRRIDAPWTTVDRECQSLHLLHLVTCDEESELGKTVWRYRLANGVEFEALRPSPEMSVRGFKGVYREDSKPDSSAHTVTDISGDGPANQDGWGKTQAKEGCAQSSTDKSGIGNGLERCTICTGAVIYGDRLEQDGRVMHPTCAMAVRQP